MDKPILYTIFFFLPVKDQFRFSRINHLWRQVFEYKNARLLEYESYIKKGLLHYRYLEIMHYYPSELDHQNETHKQFSMSDHYSLLTEEEQLLLHLFRYYPLRGVYLVDPVEWINASIWDRLPLFGVIYPKKRMDPPRYGYKKKDAPIPSPALSLSEFMYKKGSIFCRYPGGYIEFPFEWNIADEITFFNLDERYITEYDKNGKCFRGRNANKKDVENFQSFWNYSTKVKPFFEWIQYFFDVYIKNSKYWEIP